MRLESHLNEIQTRVESPLNDTQQDSNESRVSFVIPSNKLSPKLTNKFEKFFAQNMCYIFSHT